MLTCTEERLRPLLHRAGLCPALCKPKIRFRNLGHCLCLDLTLPQFSTPQNCPGRGCLPEVEPGPSLTPAHAGHKGVSGEKALPLAVDPFVISRGLRRKNKDQNKGMGVGAVNLSLPASNEMCKRLSPRLQNPRRGHSPATVSICPTLTESLGELPTVFPFRGHGLWDALFTSPCFLGGS